MEIICLERLKQMWTCVKLYGHQPTSPDQRHILNDPTQVAPYHTETARTVEQINNKV